MGGNKRETFILLPLCLSYQKSANELARGVPSRQTLSFHYAFFVGKRKLYKKLHFNKMASPASTEVQEGPPKKAERMKRVLLAALSQLCNRFQKKVHEDSETEAHAGRNTFICLVRMRRPDQYSS